MCMTRTVARTVERFDGQPLELVVDVERFYYEMAAISSNCIRVACASLRTHPVCRSGDGRNLDHEWSRWRDFFARPNRLCPGEQTKGREIGCSYDYRPG